MPSKDYYCFYGSHAFCHTSTCSFSQDDTQYFSVDQYVKLSVLKAFGYYKLVGQMRGLKNQKLFARSYANHINKLKLDPEEAVNVGLIDEWNGRNLRRVLKKAYRLIFQQNVTLRDQLVSTHDKCLVYCERRAGPELGLNMSEEQFYIWIDANRIGRTQLMASFSEAGASERPAYLGANVVGVVLMELRAEVQGFAPFKLPNLSSTSTQRKPSSTPTPSNRPGSRASSTHGGLGKSDKNAARMVRGSSRKGGKGGASSSLGYGCRENLGESHLSDLHGREQGHGNSSRHAEQSVSSTIDESGFIDQESDENLSLGRKKKKSKKKKDKKKPPSDEHCDSIKPAKVKKKKKKHGESADKISGIADDAAAIPEIPNEEDVTTSVENETVHENGAENLVSPEDVGVSLFGGTSHELEENFKALESLLSGVLMESDLLDLAETCASDANALNFDVPDVVPPAVVPDILGGDILETPSVETDHAAAASAEVAEPVKKKRKKKSKEPSTVLEVEGGGAGKKKKKKEKKQKKTNMLSDDDEPPPPSTVSTVKSEISEVSLLMNEKRIVYKKVDENLRRNDGFGAKDDIVDCDDDDPDYDAGAAHRLTSAVVRVVRRCVTPTRPLVSPRRSPPPWARRAPRLTRSSLRTSSRDRRRSSRSRSKDGRDASRRTRHHRGSAGSRARRRSSSRSRRSRTRSRSRKRRARSGSRARRRRSRSRSLRGSRSKSKGGECDRKSRSRSRSRSRSGRSRSSGSQKKSRSRSRSQTREGSYLPDSMLELFDAVHTAPVWVCIQQLIDQVVEVVDGPQEAREKASPLQDKTPEERENDDHYRHRVGNEDRGGHHRESEEPKNRSLRHMAAIQRIKALNFKYSRRRSCTPSVKEYSRDLVGAARRSSVTVAPQVLPRSTSLGPRGQSRARSPSVVPINPAGDDLNELTAPANTGGPRAHRKRNFYAMSAAPGSSRATRERSLDPTSGNVNGPGVVDPRAYRRPVSYVPEPGEVPPPWWVPPPAPMDPGNEGPEPPRPRSLLQMLACNQDGVPFDPFLDLISAGQSMSGRPLPPPPPTHHPYYPEEPMRPPPHDYPPEEAQSYQEYAHNCRTLFEEMVAETTGGSFYGANNVDEERRAGPPFDDFDPSMPVPVNRGHRNFNNAGGGGHRISAMDDMGPIFGRPPPHQQQRRTALLPDVLDEHQHFASFGMGGRNRGGRGSYTPAASASMFSHIVDIPWASDNVYRQGQVGTMPNYVSESTKATSKRKKGERVVSLAQKLQELKRAAKRWKPGSKLSSMAQAPDYGPDNAKDLANGASDPNARSSASSNTQSSDLDAELALLRAQFENEASNRAQLEEQLAKIDPKHVPWGGRGGGGEKATGNNSTNDPPVPKTGIVYQDTSQYMEWLSWYRQTHEQLEAAPEKATDDSPFMPSGKHKEELRNWFKGYRTRLDDILEADDLAIAEDPEAEPGSGLRSIASSNSGGGTANSAGAAGAEIKTGAECGVPLPNMWDCGISRDGGKSYEAPAVAYKVGTKANAQPIGPVYDVKAANAMKSTETA